MTKRPRKRMAKYKPLEEARAAVIKLGITSGPKYQFEYKQDKLLPSNPSTYYASEWKGFKYFFGKEN